LPTDFLLDAIELGDAFYGFPGNRRSLGFVDIDELAPDMGMQATSVTLPVW
jgi:hypothetical protein